jgi:hypothetical protein
MYLLKEQKGYKYLGVYLSSSGSSAEAKEDLYKRGLKALLKFPQIKEHLQILINI